MAEYMIKMADERGHVLEQVENGGSEGEMRDRYSQQGFLVYSVKPKGLFSSEVRLPQPPQDQAGAVPHLQPAVRDPDSCRTAHHSGA